MFSHEYRVARALCAIDLASGSCDNSGRDDFIIADEILAAETEALISDHFVCVDDCVIEGSIEVSHVSTRHKLILR